MPTCEPSKTRNIWLSAAQFGITTRSTVPLDRDQVTRFVLEAAGVAGRAPSIHNTQPWRWQVGDGVADLYTEPRRQLTVTDPDGRMMILSCGTALHHACVTLAGHDIAFDVARHPDDLDTDHLATLTATGRTPATPEALAMFRVLDERHTDRRPVLDQPVPPATLDALRDAVTRFGMNLDVLDTLQTIDLAGATDAAQNAEVQDAAARRKLDAWVGNRRPTGAGVPDADVPDRASVSTVPPRDFGHVGTLPVTGSHDSSASYAILSGTHDGPHAWLRAGEALSALWLTATSHHIAVLPLSAAVEEPATRQELRRILSGIGYPYLAVRLGITDPDRREPPRTPRLAFNRTVTPDPKDDRAAGTSR